MNIVVKGKHLRENQALEDFALQKSAKFYHFFPEIIKIEIELKSETGHAGKDSDFMADILVKIPGKTLKVADTERDMYKAVDRAVKRMDEALRREKDRRAGQRKKSLRKFSLRNVDFAAPFRAVNKRLFRR